jgi:hypothetical protein
MPLECCLAPSQQLCHELKHEQKIILKQLLQQRIEDGNELPARGYVGLCTADAILKEKGLKGVLLGSVAAAAMNPRRTKKELASHKDVDVIVFEDMDVERFEGGIDWWLPETSRLRVYSEVDGMASDIDVTYWYNGNNVRINCGFDTRDYKRNYEFHKGLPTGLYIPTPDWLIDTDWLVRTTHLKEFDEDVQEVFQERWHRRLRTDVPRYVRRLLDGRNCNWGRPWLPAPIGYSNDVRIALDKVIAPAIKEPPKAPSARDNHPG